MTALNASKLLLTSLTALTLLSCAGLKPFPTKDLWEYSPQDGVCGHYVITDEANLKFAHKEDVPLAQCPPIFGFTAAEIPKVLQWGRNAKRYAQDHCK